MKGKIPILTAALVILFVVTTPSTLFAETASALTNIITLDTRGDGDLTVTGRVLDGRTRAALPGAAVSLAGANTTSGANGGFTLANVDLAAGPTLTASAAGYLPQTRTVTAAAGARSVNVGDIALVTNTDKPVVEKLQPSLQGIFLPGIGMTFFGDATVNWNGNTPGNVDFYANGNLVGSQSGSGPGYSQLFSVDSQFVPRLSLGGNSISVVARSSGGLASPPLEIDLAVIPMPPTLGALIIDPANVERDGNKLEIKLSVPEPGIEHTVDLPVLGKFGAEFQFKGGFSYGFNSGQWELALGGGDASTGVVLGDFKLGVKAEARGKGVASPTTGIRLEHLSGTLGVEGEFELAQIGILDLLGPGATTGLSKIPGLNKALKAVSIVIYLKPGLEGQLNLQTYPEFAFESVELGGKLGLEAAYEPNIGIAKVKLYVGGEPSVAFKLPPPVFKEIGFKAYAGLEAKAFGLGVEFEYVFVEYTYPSAGNRLPLTGIHDLGNGYLIEAAANSEATWEAMDRPWRESGGEVFLLAPTGPDRRLSAAASESLEVFTRMAKAPAPGAIHVPAAGPGRRIASDPELPAQAALPLLENVFPDSEPTLAGAGDELMLLYVRDTGAANPVQFTEVAWTRFDGTSWTTPAAVDPDPRGQFEPAVAIDGNGDAVAVWSRIKDPAFSGTELDEMAAQIEVVTAIRDSGTGTWSATTALTDNAFLDHKPRLAGPLTDGDLILTWRENQGNLLAGTAASPTRIMTRRWDAATASWGAAEVLMDSLAGELSDSLAARGDKAVLLLARDLDGDLDDPTDAELFYRIRDEGAGSWGATTRHTADAVHDRNATVAIGADGSAYCLWQRGDDLVMDVDFSGSPTIVRPDSTSFGFSDISLTVSPAGNVVAIWQEMDEYGSDAHYRVYDPASGTWGLDTLLSQDSDLERSFATAWDPMGNLVLAYNNVEVTKQTKSVTLEGGAVIDVEGVPQPGQVDLLLAKRALVNDLRIAEDGLTAEGTDYLPGDEITLTATVRNSGNVAVENVAVSFYNGDPDDGGTLIETVTLPGWLKASDEVETSITWTVPEPAIERTVFAKVDAAGAVTESDEDNNTASLPLNGVDLQLEYVSGNVLPDGSVRVVARVRSLSAPESPVTELRLQSEDGTSTWAELEVSQLAPGDSVEIPIDLPAGSQPEGDRAYRLVVDEDGLSGDVDPSNNEVLFSLNLWIDEDGDGIPRGWEEANGMSDGDSSDADLDLDGDGFSAMDEYRAGTNPRDASSALRIGEVAYLGSPDGLSTLVSWASVEGKTYRVERSFDLGGWTTLEDDVVATPPLNTISDDGIPPDGRAFYRVEVK